MRRLVPYFLVLVLALAVPAAAYMPPSFYIKARAAADYHVQLRVGGVSPNTEADGHGICLVTGAVATIFRDRANQLRADQSITVGVPCTVPRAAVAGGTSWHDYDKIRTVKVLELFLLRRDGRFEVADLGDRIGYLEAPTTAPTIVDEAQR